MGQIVLICRLVVRDLKRRPAEAVLLLLAIAAAATTLTLAMSLRGVTNNPYDTTMAATTGPDVVADAPPPQQPGQHVDFAGLNKLIHAPGVTGYSGPYPVTWDTLKSSRYEAAAMIEGRSQSPVSVDQPQVTQGTWVKPGEVVLERAFADALGVGVGDHITLNGRSFEVAGIAVTAAIPPYPHICFMGCNLDSPSLPNTLPGLVWTTEADAKTLTSSDEPFRYLLNLRLSDPDSANGFVDKYEAQFSGSSMAPELYSWQSLRNEASAGISNERQVLTAGSSVLGLLAVATLAVLVGGRMAAQRRRVGLLKAVGATPGLVTVVLLAENLFLAVAAAVVGLLAGWLVSPVFTSPGEGLVGATTSRAPMTLTTIGLVAAMALVVAILATVAPAMRAARSSTVAALSDAARPPRRRAALTAFSARMPVPLLLGLRLAARRPRRMLLATASIAVTASGIVAVLYDHAYVDSLFNGTSGVPNPETNKLDQVMLVFTIALGLLAAVNAGVITWATMLDARRSSAVARALGATPRQVSIGLSTSQLLPALVGGLLGIPGGYGLYMVAKGSGGGLVTPPLWWLIATIIGTVVAVAVLTAIPARIGAYRPPAPILQSEYA
jgi:ABC-type antimicrobial peptide transport system permease subunit